MPRLFLLFVCQFVISSEGWPSLRLVTDRADPHLYLLSLNNSFYFLVNKFPRLYHASVHSKVIIRAGCCDGVMKTIIVTYFALSFRKTIRPAAPPTTTRITSTMMMIYTVPNPPLVVPTVVVGSVSPTVVAGVVVYIASAPTRVTPVGIRRGGNR